MAKLYPCQTCGHLVDRCAPYCPNCGRRAPAITFADNLQSFLLGAFVFIILGICAWIFFLKDFVKEIQTDSRSNNKNTINAVEKTDSEKKDAINAYKDPSSQNDVYSESNISHLEIIE